MPSRTELKARAKAWEASPEGRAATLLAQLEKVGDKIDAHEARADRAYYAGNLEKDAKEKAALKTLVVEQDRLRAELNEI